MYLFQARPAHSFTWKGSDLRKELSTANKARQFFASTGSWYNTYAHKHLMLSWFEYLPASRHTSSWFCSYWRLKKLFFMFLHFRKELCKPLQLFLISLAVAHVDRTMTGPGVLATIKWYCWLNLLAPDSSADCEQGDIFKWVTDWGLVCSQRRQQNDGPNNRFWMVLDWFGLWHQHHNICVRTCLTVTSSLLQWSMLSVSGQKCGKHAASAKGQFNSRQHQSHEHPGSRKIHCESHVAQLVTNLAWGDFDSHGALQHAKVRAWPPL